VDVKHETATAGKVSIHPGKDRLLPQGLGAPSATAHHRRVHCGESPNYEAVTESNTIPPC